MTEEQFKLLKNGDIVLNARGEKLEVISWTKTKMKFKFLDHSSRRKNINGYTDNSNYIIKVLEHGND